MMTIFTPYLAAIIIAWFGANAIKYAISTYKKEKIGWRVHMMMSGGMPSSHSATVAALTTMVGLVEGFDSTIFIVSLMFSMIVMYDAVRVRRSAGEQGVAITALIKEQGSKVKIPLVAMGHTPLEMAVGAGLGVIIGLVVFLSTN